MNNDEAKLILQAYRPGGKDANASNFQEALKQLQISPELAVWFAGEQALDSRISHKLNQSFEPPAHLKSFLLAQRKIVRPAVWWKKTHLQFGAAACLVLLATLTFVWVSSSRPIRFAQYREDMAAFTGKKIESSPPAFAQVQQWLSQNEARGDVVVPAGLSDKRGFNCRVLDWKSQKVYLICYEFSNHQVAHLLVIDKAALADPPPESPSFKQVGNVATLSWSRGNKTYLIASKDSGQSELMKLL